MEIQKPPQNKKSKTYDIFVSKKESKFDLKKPPGLSTSLQQIRETKVQIN